jgi:hypothetical protein
MSLAFEKLKPVKVPDPRVALKTPKEYLFKQGGNVVTYKTLNANSIDNNSANFKCTPPNPNIIVSSLVYLEIDCTANAFCATRANPPAAVNGSASYFYNSTGTQQQICPRQFPISSVLKTVSLKINTDTTTVPLNDYIHALARFYADDEMRAYEMASCPCMPDMYQNYGDEKAYINGGAVTGLLLGDARSPFSKFGYNTNEQSRGAYLPTSVRYDNPTTIATYTFIEPLFVSPLSCGNYNQRGLSQIQTFDVDLTFDSNLGRMWSTIATADATSFNSRFYNPNATESWAINGQINDGRIHFIYITPQITYQLPDVLIYDYHQFDRFSKIYINGNSAAPGIGGYSVSTPWVVPASGQIQVISDNVQLSCIPNKIYIYARLSNDLRGPETTDTFYRIERVNIDFNGVSGILNSASSADLWRMSCDNGLRMGFDEWYYYSGGVLCIDPSKNMGLGSQQAAAMNGTYNFSYSVDLVNLNTLPQWKLTVYTVIDYAGIITLSNQQLVKQIGIVTPRDVLDSDEVKEGDASEIEKLSGSSMMTGIKSLYSNVRNVAKKAAPYIEKALPVVDKAADYLQEHPKLKTAIKTGVKGLAAVTPLLLAAGYSHKDIQRMHAQGYRKKDFMALVNKRGGVAVGGDYRNIVGLPTGGAALSRSNLMRRAANEVNYTMM